MDIYKIASKQGTRIQTSKGPLSVEQLWNLSLDELDSLAISLQEKLEKSTTKSFRSKRTSEDKGLKLQFDLVVDVLQTREEDADRAKLIAERKVKNQKIREVIAEKQEGALKSKTITQLEKLIEEEEEA
jgi:hypothetical protein